MYDRFWFVAGGEMRKKLFSERYGFIPEKKLQKNGLDQETRNRLWNTIHIHFFEDYKYNTKLCNYEELYCRCWIIWDKYFKTCTDELNDICVEQIIQKLKSEIISARTQDNELLSEVHRTPFSPFDLLECLFKLYDKDDLKGVIDPTNSILQEEKSIYRLFPKTMQFAPIYHETDMKNLNDAFERTKGKYDSVYENLENALSAYSDREKNSYGECIENSLKAVESMANKIRDKGNDKALTGIIESVGSKINMHYNLIKGLTELYNWASDTKRHGKSNKPLEVREPEARYMLLSCSAFVNYVISLYELH
jgi:hypothetical protein